MTTRSRLFRPLTILLAAVVALTAVPALAAADTIKVDDNRTQCPLAEFTTLTAAVAAAANGDTIRVCAGEYKVPSGSPSSGLKIEKNLNIEGAGSGKVFVEPDPVPGTSLAQAVPNPRDEYGNVITVRRRLVELTHVSISGLTVRAANIPVENAPSVPNIPVEAGIAMIDVVQGSISGVTVEGIVPSATGPGTGAYAPPEPLATQGQGIIVANTIEATDDETTISGSEIKGFNATGILVDNRLLDGSGQVGNDSHMKVNVVNTKITGATTVANAATLPISQTGIEGWGSGVKLDVADSRISKVGKADASAAAVALHGVDVAASELGGSPADAVNLTENLYGVTSVAYGGTPPTDTLDATGDFWGTTVTSGGLPTVGFRVAYEPVAAAAPPATTVTPAIDLPPTVQWDTRPADGTVVKAGVPIPLAVVAGDDFGVNKVEFRLAGTLLGVAPTPALGGERLYTLEWTPTPAQIAELYGAELPLSAIAVDSAAKITQASVPVNIEGPPRLSGAAGTIAGRISGYAKVGVPLTCEGGDASYPAATLAYEWTVAGVPVGSGPTYMPVAADQSKQVVCTVFATNESGSKSQTGGAAVVAELPRLASGPALSGAAGTYALVGQALTCTANAAATTPAGTITYQWLRDGVATADGPTYTVLAGDERHEIACLATVSSPGGSSGTPVAIAVGGAPVGGAPALSGGSEVGSVLTCDPGTWSAVPAPTLAFAWFRDGAPIAGSGGTSYTVGAADAGARISCQVTAANALGSATAGSVAIEIAKAPPAITPVKPPVVTMGSGKVSGAKAIVASVSCDSGPCKISAPKTVKVKIGGKSYAATILVPTTLAAGKTAEVVVKLPPKARKALAKAGHSAKLSFTVKVSGGGGTAKQVVAVKLAAAPK
jgi:hypothetical protein